MKYIIELCPDHQLAPTPAQIRENAADSRAKALDAYMATCSYINQLERDQLASL